MSQPVITDVFIAEPPCGATWRGGRPAGTADALAELLPGAEEILRILSSRIHSGESTAADVLLRQFLEFVGGRAALVVLSDTPDEAQRASVRLFLEKAARAVSGLETDRQEAAIAKLADVILPDPLADARGPLALDNLELRDRFVTETHPLTSVEVAKLAGSRGTNPYATATRWKNAGQIFSVRHRGGEYYPAFQFRDGRPHPAMRKVLLSLPAQMTPWQRAFWFVSTNGWLDGDTPAKRLDDQDSVVAAALREAHEVAG